MPRGVQGMAKKSKRFSAVKKKKAFSVVKAVKSNARERVGQPKPEQVIDDKPRESRRAQKHKPTLAELLEDRN